MGFFDRFKKPSTVEVEEKSEVVVDPVVESQRKIDEAIRELERAEAANVRKLE